MVVVANVEVPVAVNKDVLTEEAVIVGAEILFAVKLPVNVSPAKVGVEVVVKF
jgi:hypothetical protein